LKFEEVCYGRQTIKIFWSHQIQQSEMAILPASLKGIPNDEKYSKCNQKVIMITGSK
jgi:hypothetical protein